LLQSTFALIALRDRE
jgi:hypothetical protein